MSQYPSSKGKSRIGIPSHYYILNRKRNIAWKENIKGEVMFITVTRDIGGWQFCADTIATVCGMFLLVFWYGANTQLLELGCDGQNPVRPSWALIMETHLVSIEWRRQLINDFGVWTHILMLLPALAFWNTTGQIFWPRHVLFFNLMLRRPHGSRTNTQTIFPILLHTLALSSAMKFRRFWRLTSETTVAPHWCWGQHDRSAPEQRRAASAHMGRCWVLMTWRAVFVALVNRTSKKFRDTVVVL